MPEKRFIIVWDDGQGLCAPLGFDEDCPGAVCCTNAEVALFPSRPSARKAIRISKKYAALRQAQGLPENTDFVGESARYLQIIPCRHAPA